MNSSLLLSLGLSPEQSRIYLSLIETGPQSASVLAKSAKVQRTYIYNLTKDLEEKNLLRTKKEGKATLFVANSPDLLMSLAEAKKQEASQTITLLDDVLPEMKKLFASNQDRPIISYFDGIEGIKKIYTDTLNEGKPISALLDDATSDIDLRSWLRQYSLKRAMLNIHARVILSSGKAAEEYMMHNEKSLRDVRVVPKKQFPFQHEINIYGDKVAILQYQQGESVLGIIIHHPIIAKSMLAWFELAWFGADKLTSTLE